MPTVNFCFSSVKGDEPADLTEQQWDRVMSNNRVLHGYWYDAAKKTMRKARRRGMSQHARMLNAASSHFSILLTHCSL